MKKAPAGAFFLPADISGFWPAKSADLQRFGQFSVDLA
jgi:hypothetical protein